MQEQQVTCLLDKLPNKVKENFLDRLLTRSFQNASWSHVDRVKARQLNRYYSYAFDSFVTSARLSGENVDNAQIQRRELWMRNLQPGVGSNLAKRFPNVKKLIIGKDVEPEQLDQIAEFRALQEIWFEDVEQVWDLVEVLCEDKEVLQRLYNKCNVSFPLSSPEEYEEIVALSELLGPQSQVILRWHVSHAWKYRPGFQELLQVLTQTMNCRIQLEGLCNLLPSEWYLINKQKITEVEFQVQSERYQQFLQFLSQFLRDNQTLDSLTLRWQKITRAQFSSMPQKLKASLQRINNLKWSSEESSMYYLREFPNVTHVEMKQADDNICNMKSLLKLPMLRSLVIQFPEMTRQCRWQHMVMIGQLKKLTTLELFDKEQTNGYSVNAALSSGEVKYISRLDKLRKLTLNFDDIAIKDLSFLQSLRSLDDLNIVIVGRPGLDVAKINLSNVRNVQIHIQQRQPYYGKQCRQYQNEVFNPRGIIQ